MPAFVDRAKSRLTELRREHPALDHALRTQEHYGETKAGQQAGAVTYFGFLSVFPVLALAFFVVGWVAKVYPDAQDTLQTSVMSMFPGLIGNGPSKLNIEDFQNSAATAGVIGLVGVLYSGLGWLSALRDALIAVFALPDREQPSFVMGKARDLLVLVIIGTVLLVAVAFTGLVSGFSSDLLDWLGLSTALGWLVTLLTVALGLLANAVLFFAMFRLLAAPDVPRRAMWSGALLGAVGFEILKQVSGLLIRSTQGQPAFQVFGLTLVLLVWINYFSRLVLYAASWAWTHPLAREERVVEPAAPVEGPPLPSVDELPTDDGEGSGRKGAFVAGAALGAAAAAAVVTKARSDDA
ncbi:YihY/virulence factor BrkB family protein [Nocardioides anomalus]|uniref:YihY/virulence factor BrkB family protein n=1 Tax=Nocardioides anomalus TaxID=2712223 RepID=A0A6G6WFY1_9ACTN|nr:YihY/virulence factor BrkB family protein [Nocardioides anomalus]QIG44142.1 YihY/virulence factor BrkB family protein [Nocardioides anomalus]